MFSKHVMSDSIRENTLTVSPLSHPDRVRLTLRGEPTDHPATGEFFIADEFARAFLQLPPAAPIGNAERSAIIEQLDLDIATVSFSAGWGALVQPDENLALEELVQWSAAGDRFAMALIDGPFSAAARSRGFNILMHYCASARPAARELFREGADETIVTAQAVRDAGASGLVLGEDIAYSSSLYISPALLRELYFPELIRAARAIREMGLAVFFHSDGNLKPILGDLAACELDGIQGLEPEAGMTMDLVRREVGPALTLWGNLGFDFLSAPRSGDEITRARDAITPHGKIILGSSPGLVQGLNPDTVRRVYQTLR